VAGVKPSQVVNGLESAAILGVSGSNDNIAPQQALSRRGSRKDKAPASRETCRGLEYFWWQGESNP
jgi:hypothetical protein